VRGAVGTKLHMTHSSHAHDLYPPSVYTYIPNFEITPFGTPCKAPKPSFKQTFCIDKRYIFIIMIKLTDLVREMKVNTPGIRYIKNEYGSFLDLGDTIYCSNVLHGLPRKDFGSSTASYNDLVNYLNNLSKEKKLVDGNFTLAYGKDFQNDLVNYPGTESLKPNDVYLMVSLFDEDEDEDWDDDMELDEAITSHNSLARYADAQDDGLFYINIKKILGGNLLKKYL
jgi:hypothetical protein